MIFTKEDSELPDWAYHTNKKTISIQKQLFAKYFCKIFNVKCYKINGHKKYLYRFKVDEKLIDDADFMQSIPKVVEKTLKENGFGKIKEYNIKQLIRSIRKHAKTVYDDEHGII